jgi:hypothetical protein
MIPSVPPSAENCGSKLCSALVRTTRNVFAGSAARADPPSKLIAITIATRNA